MSKNGQAGRWGNWNISTCIFGGERGGGGGGGGGGVGWWFGLHRAQPKRYSHICVGYSEWLPAVRRAMWPCRSQPEMVESPSTEVAISPGNVNYSGYQSQHVSPNRLIHLYSLASRASCAARWEMKQEHRDCSHSPSLKLHRFDSCPKNSRREGAIWGLASPSVSHTQKLRDVRTSSATIMRAMVTGTTENPSPDSSP